MRYKVFIFNIFAVCIYAFLSIGIAAAQDLQNYALSETDIEHLEKCGIVTHITKAPKGRTDIFGAVDIAASPADIWAIMTDCTAQLDIIPKLKSCDVLETGPLNSQWDRRRQVLKLGFPLPPVKSEFRSDYTPYKSILITGTGGDLSVLNGKWTLTPLSETRTRLTYHARMKSALPVPAGFIRKAARKDMPITLRNLRQMAEAPAS